MLFVQLRIAALALKANVSDVYAKTDTYTRSEVDKKNTCHDFNLIYYTKIRN
jgi:hypothetical protein